MRYGRLPIREPERVFFVGDVHGHAVNLKKILDKILPQLGPKDHLVFGGDLVNGEPNTAKVLEMITELRDQYPEQVFNLRGNHEVMLLLYCLDQNRAGMNQFGQATLTSMQQRWQLPGIEPETIKAALMDRGIWDWLWAAPLYYETPDLICTHAPLKFSDLINRGLDTYDGLQEPFLLDRGVDMLWNFVEETDDVLDDYITKTRVCGHQYQSGLVPRIYDNRVFVDTGCGRRPNSPLSCVVFPERKIIQSETYLNLADVDDADE